MLPAIQREFVWSTNQITKLFDSIMRGSPVGSFLLWDVKRETASIWPVPVTLSRSSRSTSAERAWLPVPS